MTNKLILLTGIPGIGKSTITQYLEKKIKPIVRFSFGDLIYEVLQQKGVKCNRLQIRKTPDKFVTINIIKYASKILLERAMEARKINNVVIESHAVVRDFYGFWVIPEITDFKSARLDAIIVIHTSFNTFRKRMNRAIDGRYEISNQTFQKYQSLLDSVAINFSLKAGCPLYVVETGDDVDKTCLSLLHIFNNIGMKYNKKRILEGSLTCKH